MVLNEIQCHYNWMWAFYMYVCLSLKPCLINWIDLGFLVKHIKRIMKQAAQIKKNISPILSNISLGPLKADTSLLPPALKGEQKHFIFDKWDLIFSLKPFHFQDALWEVSPFGLSFPVNDVDSEGGSQSQLFSKWFVNQRLKEEIHYQIRAKQRKKKETNFI